MYYVCLPFSMSKIKKHFLSWIGILKIKIPEMLLTKSQLFSKRHSYQTGIIKTHKKIVNLGAWKPCKKSFQFVKVRNKSQIHKKTRSRRVLANKLRMQNSVISVRDFLALALNQLTCYKVKPSHYSGLWQ